MPAPSPQSLSALCPLCGGADNVEAQVQDLTLAAHGTARIGFGYCRTCGHIHQVRRASDELLAHHYAAYSNYTCFDPEASRKAPPGNLTKRLLSLAEARAPKGIAYEVGCATGYHLVHFRRAGWDVGGCDPSARAVDQAKTIFGINIDCGMDAQCLPKRSALSIVLFSHVLEHMTDPIGALKLAHAALGDEGVVLLEVPCATTPHSGAARLVHARAPALFLANEPDEPAGRGRLRAGGIPHRAQGRTLSRHRGRRRQGVKAGAPVAIAPDAAAVTQTEAFIAQLLAHDEAIWRGTGDRLAGITGPVYVWGAGVHTAQLFDRTSIYAQVKGIIDRDSQKWGSRLGDHTIISPDDFFARRDDAPVVISSFAAEAQIARGLADAGVASRNIVRLYG